MRDRPRLWSGPLALLALYLLGLRSVCAAVEASVDAIGISDGNVSVPVTVPPLLGSKQGFMLLGEIEAFMRAVNTGLPHLSRPLEPIGTSSGGRPLYRLCMGQCAADSDVPAVLFTGMHHAREVCIARLSCSALRTLLTKLHGAFPRSP